jgi:profilin
MVGSGHVDKGAIYSVKGDSVWASSAGFSVRATPLSSTIALHSQDRLEQARVLEIEGSFG